MRVEGGLFFANADTVRGALRADAAKATPHAVVLDAQSIPTVDITAVSMLVELSREFHALGVRMVLAHNIGQVRELFRAANAEAPLDDVYPSVQAAVDAVS